MFAFTREERQVLLFIIAVSLTGTGINFLVRTNSDAKAIAANWQDIGRVEINSANEELLMTVPGIGKRLAERIIQYRESQESFRELAELKNIKGVSTAKYEKIKDYLYVK
jgi:competence ComEA-like helix-hairpin-helix protein